MKRYIKKTAFKSVIQSSEEGNKPPVKIAAAQVVLDPTALTMTCAAAIFRGERIQCMRILFDVKASENIRFETKGSTQTEPSQGACYLSLPPRTGREHKPQAIP